MITRFTICVKITLLKVKNKEIMLFICSSHKRTEYLACSSSEQTKVIKHS